MDVTKLISYLPDSVKVDVADYENMKIKGRNAIRVTLDRLLTDVEKANMSNRHFVGLDCVCHYKYAPEIKHSYFYVL